MTAAEDIIDARDAEADIAEDGRPIILRRLSRAESNENDWQVDNDPRASLDAEVNTSGIFVPPASLSELGYKVQNDDLLKLSDKICIVSPGHPSKGDFERFDEVVDGDTIWKIETVETLQPGTITILYFIGLSHGGVVA